MNYLKQFGKSIDEAFADFDRDNPEVYNLFKKFADKWINKQLEQNGNRIKKVRISSKQIIGAIRWHTSVETNSTDYKINDGYTSLYARKFIEDFPQYKDVFELRRIRRNRQSNLFHQVG